MVKLFVKKGAFVVAIASALFTGAAELSQSYDDYVVNRASDYEDKIIIPEGYKIKVNVKEIDMTKSPFRREVANYKREQKRLNKAVKKMNKRFEKHVSKSRETAAHKSLRDRVKQAKKLIVKRYNLICGPYVPKLAKLSHQIRNVRRKMETASGPEKEKMELLAQKYLAEYDAILQPLIDNVFVYYKFPRDGTSDNKMYPRENRNFYNLIDKSVQRAIKKGGVAVSNGKSEDDDDDDDENASDKYTRKFTETTKDFLEEHFSAEPSEKFNKINNPFKSIHKYRIKELAKLSKLREKMANDLSRKGGRFRETSYHERQREITRESAKKICRIFHKLLKKDADVFNRHADQVRRWLKEIAIHEGSSKAKYAEQQYARNVELANKALQKMIDKALGYEPWPSTEQEYRVPAKYRSLYEKASKIFYQG